MAWIILGHRYEALMFSATSNINAVAETFMRRPISMTVLNALVAVDTFFFLSGLLVCFVFFREMERSNTFNLIKFYVFRFLRLTVPMAVVVIFYAFFLIHVGNGPNWNAHIQFLFTDFCKENWWTTLLYVNNYVKPLETCISQTWYTSVDMQLAWFSPLVLLPLYYAPRVGQQLLALFIAISCFIPFTITYLNNYPWNSVVVNQDYFNLNEWLKAVYLPTHTRTTPYLVGMMVGYYIFKTRAEVLKLSKVQVIAGWLLCTATCLTVIYTFAIPYRTDYEYEPVAAAFYAGFHRLGWTLGLAWIVISCSKGYGGPVNSILSWTWFLPFSKLTYAAYLTHVVVINAYVATFKATEFYSSYEIVHGYFGDLPIIICASMLLHIFVEAPVIAHLHRKFKRGKHAYTSTSTTKTTSRT